jgi:hypothetical protein
MTLDDERNRGRSLSPTNRRSRSQGRQANSTGRKSRTIDSNSPIPKDGRNDDPTDSLTDTATPLASGGVASNDRRSRSYSSGPQRSNQRGSSASKLPPKSNQTSRISTQSSGVGGGGANPSGGGTKQSSALPSSQRVPPLFSTLKCFPSDINKYINGRRGPIHGIWITDHPLSSLPASYYETVSLIDSYPASILTDNKRAEWEMDLLREYDEKRMDRLEEYLISCRKNIDEQIKHTSRREDRLAAKKSTESKR